MTDSAVNQDAQPLVWNLRQNDGHLDEWLTAHPPSRLVFPPAFNNGVAAQPIWAVSVGSKDQLAELCGSTTTDETFIRANQLAREAAAKVSDIQNDKDIPVRSSNKTANKSKKQCRTEVQDQFHEQILRLAADHPLWDQGRWTMIVKPQQMDQTFSQLVQSLASGELRKQGSILAIRARPLPFAESTYEHNVGAKRKKSFSGRRSSSKSPTSARVASEAPLGIDVFFQPVWNSSAARDVLHAIAGVSGRMASFCRSSLYSCLGIRSGHLLAARSTLYNAKTLASPADVKLWTGTYTSRPGETERWCLRDDAEPFSQPESSSSSEEYKVVSSKVVADGAEPALKKARSAESAKSVQPIGVGSAPALVKDSKDELPETQDSQEEPMLPMRPVAKAPQTGTPNTHGQFALSGEECSPPAPIAGVSLGVTVKHTISATTSFASEGNEESQNPAESVSTADDINLAREHLSQEATTVKEKVAGSSAAEIASGSIQEDTAVSAPRVSSSAETAPAESDETKEAVDSVVTKVGGAQTDDGSEQTSEVDARSEPGVKHGAQRGSREEISASTAKTTSPKPKSQASLGSVAEMSIDDLLVEGVAAPATEKSQWTSDPGAK